MPALPAINNLRTSLINGMDVLDLVASVATTTGWPDEGIFSVDEEIIHYSSKTATTFNGLIRGFDGTVPVDHALGAMANLRIVAKHMNDAAFINTEPTTVTVGGIPAGSTFPERLTVQEMMTRLLYPYQNPAVTMFRINGYSSPFEVGFTIPASVVFAWTISNPSNVQAGSLSIQDVTGGVTLATGLNNDGSEPVVMPGSIQKVIATSHQFRLNAVNTNAQPFQGDLVLSWQWRMYYGASASPTLNEAGIEGLGNNLLASGYARTYAITAGGYKYICQANSAGGGISSVKDAATGFNVPFADASDHASYNNVDGGGFSYALVSVTNVHGIMENYRVYRSKNLLGGAVTLIVT